MQDMLSEVRSKVDFDIDGPLPMKNVDTGMGLERMASHPAGRRQHLRDRHHLQDPRAGGRAHRAGLRHRPPQRRGAAGRRRPRAQRGDADRGRGAAGQRGRQLRAAPAAAPQHPQPAAAVRRAARRRRVVGHRVHARADRDHHRRDGRAVPRAAPRRGQHPPGHRRGGRGLRRHAPHRHRDLRRGGRGDQAQARQRALRRAGVPAPRHLRLPDRPHPGDGGRAGACGGRGGLPPADGRAAGPGQEGRAGEEDRQRRHLRLRLAARAGGQGHLHRLRHGRGRGDRGRPARGRRAGERRPPPAWRSRSCSTGPRSTPRAAASSATTA